MIAKRKCVFAPGVHDVLSANILCKSGFDALYLGGNAIGLAHGKGQPFVTLTETAETTARIARVSDAALIVDAGAGFGGRAHIAEAVREIERAGAAALHIDDQVFPKSVNYHRGRGEIISAADMADRLRVARKALAAETVLIARTDALRETQSVDDVVARGRAYLDAGADMLLVLDASPATAPKIRQALLGAPIGWIGGVAPPIPSAEELQGAGFALALYPFNTVAAIADAVQNVWSGFHETGLVNMSADVLSRMRTETLDLVGMRDFWAIEDAVDE